MNRERTYLDHNASAPLRPEALAAMTAALEVVGNASSVHAEGRRARALIEEAREEVAALVNARPSEIVFTSGATESNNWVVGAGWDTVLVAGIEHDSVLAPAVFSATRCIELAVSPAGQVAVEAADQMLAEAGRRGRALICVQIANNETGVLQPVAEIATGARSAGVSFHTDAVQAVGRIPVDFANLGVDFMSLSSHKLGGPKGVGALVIRDGLDLPPMLRGGGQERRRRAGTENVAAIAGFGAAAAAARRELCRAARLGELRDRVEQGVARLTPQAVVLGAGAPRLPNTSCIALPKAAAALTVIKMDLAGVAIGAGSACSSGKLGVSHVLAAMGVAPALAEAAVRVSLGWNSEGRDVDAFLQAWDAMARGLRFNETASPAAAPARAGQATHMTAGE
ncbi:MAG TPA: cysteine desulfurase family protein [Hyphomicrobiaceae bacterium]|nr:cysteine desulfurase family protein [Hyphomicrobiaceae bacterium]